MHHDRPCGTRLCDDDSFEATLRPSGWRLAAPASKSLLAAAQQAGIRLPSSCRNGTCRACMCRLLTGQVAYRIEWPGLSAEEKQEGWILPCVAHPASDVELEVPHAAPLAAER
ncbi:2Fe-2S iron-sulfur cluster-binding protein [Aquabacterium sp. A7-Y]|uniref:2Fe-2S iron-sulfur cluster-binding protein n=1 Tax=Aquabacterium sp. A7-Y TaxID=1349605 RepID=UPI00223DE757|nr:2Fe-2S iron-sulfur cluster-binding protein [Aquabacterium sp. A7-Y]MCW7539263.1 2Fe-2S iron-sulfur cluster-binding protein [Aquabacterium sp. A7-Y]